MRRLRRSRCALDAVQAIELPPNGVAVLYEADAGGVDHQLPGGIGYLDALVQFAGEVHPTASDA